MWGIPSSVRIFLFTEPTDMRKGPDGLAALVRQLGEDVYSGHLFVFAARRRDRVKILSWSPGGFVLWYKRLDRGRFRLPKLPAGDRTVSLDAAALGMLLEGIDLDRVSRPEQWLPKSRRGESERRRTSS
jgi:transposase